MFYHFINHRASEMWRSRNWDRLRPSHLIWKRASQSCQCFSPLLPFISTFMHHWNNTDESVTSQSVGSVPPSWLCSHLAHRGRQLKPITSAKSETSQSKHTRQLIISNDFIKCLEERSGRRERGFTPSLRFGVSWTRCTASPQITDKKNSFSVQSRLGR